MTEQIEQPMDEKSASEMARSIYADFSVWKKPKVTPKWHPIKKMRYVFFRMICGCTITDALAEIRWNPSEFWHLLDLKRNDPFRLEYNRAKQLQGRAIGDTVIRIAEGRDATTQRSLRRVKKLFHNALRRAAKQKSPLAVKTLIDSVMAQLSENEQRIIARNKLQIDAAKWLAKSVNPGEFSEKTSLALSGATGEDGTGPVQPILIQFIGPDGSVVAPT